MSLSWTGRETHHRQSFVAKGPVAGRLGALRYLGSVGLSGAMGRFLLRGSLLLKIKIWTGARKHLFGKAIFRAAWAVLFLGGIRRRTVLKNQKDGVSDTSAMMFRAGQLTETLSTPTLLPWTHTGAAVNGTGRPEPSRVAVISSVALESRRRWTQITTSSNRRRRIHSRV